MVNSVEIDFVLNSESGIPSLSQLSEAFNMEDNYEASLSEFDTVYVAENSNGPNVGCTLETYEASTDWATLPSLPAITMAVTTSQLEGGNKIGMKINSMLRHVSKLYLLLDECQYVYSLDPEHLNRIDKEQGADIPVTPKTIVRNHIDAVSWLMLFPPEMVEEYGREWLLSAPAWERRELDDGAIMLVASPDPTDWEEATTARQTLSEYFGFEE